MGFQLVVPLVREPRWSAELLQVERLLSVNGVEVYLLDLQVADVVSTDTGRFHVQISSLI